MLLACVLAPLSASAQLPKSMLPEFVAEFNKQLPTQVEPGLIFKSCELVNNGSEMQFTFSYDLSVEGISSDALIAAFKSFTPAEKAEMLGAEFADVANMIPVPIYAKFVFSDGATYRMRLAN